MLLVSADAELQSVGFEHLQTDLTDLYRVSEMKIGFVPVLANRKAGTAKPRYRPNYAGKLDFAAIEGYRLRICRS